MSYKTILAVVDTPRNAARVSTFAATLAQQFDAHLVGLHAETLSAVPLIAPMEIPDPTAVELLQDSAEKEAAAVADIFRQNATRDGLSMEWRSFMLASGYASSSVLETARTADLIVAAHGGAVDSDRRSDLETFLYESGRPLLLVPHLLEGPRPLSKVLLAWNGSREAARAAFDALPLMKQAGAVEVFVVDPPERGDRDPALAGADIAATLRRHGLDVSLTTMDGGGHSPAAAIEQRLSEGSIDLLVMGGFGHSRWWEMLFGGVTRSLINSMKALTLLSR